MTKVVIFETNKNKISIANFDEKKIGSYTFVGYVFDCNLFWKNTLYI